MIKVGIAPALYKIKQQQGNVMKLLIVFIFTLLSFNVFAEEGENQKSECQFANQSNKREAKVVLPIETEIKKEAQSSNTSK